MRLTLALLLSLLVPTPSFAWNATGHQVVASLAWDAMTPQARQRVIALLTAAPADGCVVDLLPTDRRPLAARQREFFLRVSTWADIVRPSRTDTRPCTRFHRGEWHYVNFFWEGVSGATDGRRPTERHDMPVATANIMAQLPFLRALAACDAPRCGTTRAERAIALAWILHLAGDIHQPLHTSGRVTTAPGEDRGDQGGNLFVLQAGPPPLNLHGYWDGILDRSVPRQGNEPDAAYAERVAAAIAARHPRPSLAPRLRSGAFEAWAREGFERTKASAFPATLKRGELPGEQYRANTFAVAQEAIALAGYRLGDLLNRMLGS